MLRTLILHNNDALKLITNWKIKKPESTTTRPR